jgi:hypothetical protein|tara:strand:+ start:503 stop:682 length:180 start_codon:yes stop_codon:yes gene_type:complete
MSFWDKVADFFGWVKVRTRDKHGRYIADDKATPENEAYKRVHKSLAPKSKKVVKKRKKK